MRVVLSCPYCGSRRLRFQKAHRCADILMSVYKCEGCGREVTTYRMLQIEP